jgi:hypothetical protein
MRRMELLLWNKSGKHPTGAAERLRLDQRAVQNSDRTLVCNPAAQVDELTSFQVSLEQPQQVRKTREHVGI